MLIGCSSAEAALIAEAREALTSALNGGPSPDETLYRAQSLTRLVETYDRRKAAALFDAFKQNGTWQVPTFGALASVWNARRGQLNPADAAATESASRTTIEMFAEMRRAGVKVLAGSDLPVAAGVPPIHDELVALVRAGTTPVEALQASTRNAADFLGRLAGEGTVEVGKKANLVLLEADPLADIANTRRIAAVVKILRTANGDVVLTVSGRLTADNVSDLSALIAAEPAGRTIVLDLKDIVLVDRAIVRFLRESEAAILLESK